MCIRDSSNPATEQVPNPIQPVGGPLIPFNGNQGRALVTRAEAVYPYPHFGGMTVQRSIGWSNYHALVVQVNRNFANGLQMNAHYTWSKSLDFAQTEAQGNGYAETGSGYLGMNLRDYRNSYKLAYTDVPHRLLLTYVYELPFGAGKRFSSQNAVAKTLMSGWRIGGVATFQSGFPAQLSGGSSGAMNGLPDRIPDVPAEVPKQLQGWYDGKTTVTLPSGRQIRPSAFTYLKYSSDAFRGRVVTTPDGSIVNDIYWFGNAAFTYGDIRGAGLNNWNMSVERTFRPRESLSVEFSAQFTNAFNHTQFRPQMTAALGGTSVLAAGAANNPMNIQPGQGSSSDFGTRGNSTFDPRQVELQLKVRF